MSEPFEPEIVVIYCGRGLAKDEYLPEGTKTDSGFRVRYIMIPCSSKIETGNLVKLIEQGNDGVMIVACPENQCQFLVGSTRAENRIKHARSLLDEVGIGADRLGMVRGHNLSTDDFRAFAQERANAVRALGLNPMKSTRR
ncbi:MAG: hydrogenase iron-sulfur subunit [Dehalococcoidia bacterium]